MTAKRWSEWLALAFSALKTAMFNRPRSMTVFLPALWQTTCLSPDLMWSGAQIADSPGRLLSGVLQCGLGSTHTLIESGPLRPLWQTTYSVACIVDDMHGG